MFLLLGVLALVNAQCSPGQCSCSWASAATCGSNDGSVCNQCCCAPFRGGDGGVPPQPTPVFGNDASPSPASAGWRTGVTTRYWDCCKASARQARPSSRAFFSHTRFAAILFVADQRDRRQSRLFRRALVRERSVGRSNVVVAAGAHVCAPQRRRRPHQQTARQPCRATRATCALAAAAAAPRTRAPTRSRSRRPTAF